MIHNLKFLVSFVSSLLFVLSVYGNDILPTTKVLYAKYTDIPKVVYTKQKFQVGIDIKVLVPSSTTFSIETTISENPNITKLNDDIIWYKTDKNSYHTTIKYKVGNKYFKLPSVNIAVVDINNTILDQVKLPNQNIIYRKIAINQQNYSKVIATNLNILSVRTKQYKNNQLLSLLVMEASNSNLEDFYLDKYTQQGVKDISVNNGIEKLYYYVIIPSHTKEIDFDYYNSISNEFVHIRVPIDLKEELVSTQTDLNPLENSMLIYKKISLAAIIFVFLIIYFFKRKGRYLFVSVFFMTILILLMKPNATMVLNKGEKVYILPTSNSIVYKITQQKQKVMILQKKEKFTKILFDNKTLGWIKNG